METTRKTLFPPDDTENMRRHLVAEINGEVKPGNEADERKRLEAVHGQVWDTKQLQEDFEVKGFLAPFVIVERKRDNQRGVMMFQQSPRFYFDFQILGHD
jgi:hypothetical protein